MASLNGTRATVVGECPPRLGPTDAEGLPPMRVGLLGLGTVGGGVYRALSSLHEHFEITRVAVRNLKRAADSGAEPYVLTDDPWKVVEGPAETIIETIGGLEPAQALVEAALNAGKHVVTANKTLLATCGEELEALARQRGVRLLYAASVGGGVPVLETLRRLAEGDDPVEAVRGVVNGTSNFVLDRVGEGESFDAAVKAAQAAGFAEADPTKDLDGTDAAEKLALAARAAFGVSPEEVEVGVIERRGVAEALALRSDGRGAAGGAVRLVARAERAGGGVRLSVGPELLPASDALAGTRGERNRVVARLRSGREVEVHGKGAGRWPTTEAVIGDLLELARERAERGPAELSKGRAARVGLGR